jgi:tRNA 2-thiouridine synthesizing protein E
MPSFQAGSQTLEIDEDGFIQEPDKWNNEVAEALAKTEGVEELGEGGQVGWAALGHWVRSSR